MCTIHLCIIQQSILLILNDETDIVSDKYSDTYEPYKCHHIT